MRPFSDSETIKSATAASFDALGGVSAAAGVLGVRSSTLTKYASVGDDWKSSFIRLDLAVALDRATTHPFLLTAMQRLVSGDRPRSAGALTASAILRLDGVLDDVVREAARAIEDDHLDSAERRAIRSRIVAAKQQLASLDAIMAERG